MKSAPAVLPVQRAPQPPAAVHQSAQPRPSVAPPRGAGRLARALGNQSYGEMVETRLEVGPGNDPLELEAERTADKVMRMAEPGPGGKVGAAVFGRSASNVVRRRDLGPGSSGAASHVRADTASSSIHSLRGGGRPLSPSALAFFQPRLGVDLSRVRIHTGAEAAEAAEALQARAFTLGRDIVFGAGEYNPESPMGKRLLAHELTHTLQQREDSRRIQRALKFEIQTSNFIWQKPRRGKFSHVPRKFGEFGKTERGDLPAYITTGKHGVKARKKGDVEYVEVKGKRAMKRAKADTMKYVDATGSVPAGKMAQFITFVVIHDSKVLTSGKKPKKKDLSRITWDREKSMSPADLVKDIHETYYVSTPNPLLASLEVLLGGLPYHQDPDGRFQPGVKRLMRGVPVIRDGIDETIPAQFEKEYRFKTSVTEAGIIGKPVGPGENEAGEIELTGQVNNAGIMVPGTYNPNTFEFLYYNSDGTQLDVHLDPDGNFKKKHVAHMKVGRKKPAGIDKGREAQYVETWRVTEDSNGSISYYDPIKGAEVMVRLEEVSSLREDHGMSQAVPFNANTYEKKYFKASEFSGDNLKANALQLPVHLEDGRLEGGHVKFMRQRVSPGSTVRVGGKRVDVGEEQTAMELQSEDHGFIEFETPKWFRNWEDLKLRVQDAVDMTKELSGGTQITLTPRQKKQMEAVKKKDDRIKNKNVGDVREWPSSLVSPGVSKKLGSNQLFVEIVDHNWPAFFQTSEGIPLTEVDSILQDRMMDAHMTASDVIFIANDIYQTTKASSPFAARDDSLFANLKGFLELVVTYIIWGQIRQHRGHKDTFLLMARTDFGSMYTSLLKKHEKELFAMMVGKKNDPRDNPIFTTDLEDAINSRLGTSLTLNRRARFYRGGHSGGKSRNPPIYRWLRGITRGKDLLSGKQKSVSDAIGGRKVNTTAGDKDYNQALFEKRRDWIIKRDPTFNPDGTIKAVGWVGHAKKRFDDAMKRTADTPDNPVTPAVNESAKTSIKLK